MIVVTSAPVDVTLDEFVLSVKTSSKPKDTFAVTTSFTFDFK
ncbi:MAG: hypothetical protein ACO29X_05330 [Arcobacteraceae bacterium]